MATKTSARRFQVTTQYPSVDQLALARANRDNQELFFCDIWAASFCSWRRTHRYRDPPRVVLKLVFNPVNARVLESWDLKIVGAATREHFEHRVSPNPRDSHENKTKSSSECNVQPDLLVPTSPNRRNYIKTPLDLKRSRQMQRKT